MAAAPGAALIRVCALLRPQRRRVLLSFGLGAGIAWISTTLPLIIRGIVDNGLLGGRRAALAGGIALLLALAVLRWAASALRTWLDGLIGTEVEQSLRGRLAGHLLALEPAWHERRRTGQSLSLASSDISAIRVFLAFAQQFSVLNVITCAVAVARMWTLSPALTVAALALSPPLVVAAARFSRRLHIAFRAIQDSTGELAGVVEETAAGVRVVKALGGQRLRQAKLDEQAAALLSAALGAARLRALYRPLLGMLPQLSLVIVLWYGGRMVIDGRITLGTLIAFNSYLLLLAAPVTSAGAVFGVAQRAAASADRIFTVLDEPTTIADRPGAHPLDVACPAGFCVTVQDVVFRGTRMSFELARGERAMLTGADSPGRAAFGSLLLRLDEPQAGRILLDGQDIAAVTLSSLRGAVCVADAEPVLFSGTVRENVAFARPEAADADIWEALHAAAAADFVRLLPQSLNTGVGERGYSLSGGQRQRIALARALLTRPRLLVLDDALSHVDQSTEAFILDHLPVGCTILLIGGREAARHIADRILSADGAPLEALR